MRNSSASLINKLYQKLGRALELSMYDDMEDSDYWNGHVDALLDLLSDLTGQSQDLIKSRVQEAFTAMDFQYRVNEVFDVSTD